MTNHTLYFSSKKNYTVSALFSHFIFMTALFLAQFWGLVFIIMSVGMFVRPENVQKIVKLAQDEGLLIFSGFIGVMLGVGHILLFNEWYADWTILITLIGWITLFKGLIRVFIPKWTQKFIKDFHSKSSNTRSALVIIFLLGLYLAMKGFEL